MSYVIRIKLYIILSLMYNVIIASCERRLYKGTIVSQKEFPYIAFVQIQIPEYVCTGAILHKDWILTAASCCTLQSNLSVKQTKDISVLGGFLMNSSEQLQSKFVGQIIVNELHDKEIGSPDMCLLKLKESFNMTRYVNVVEIESTDWPKKGKQSRKNCVEVGWGVLRVFNGFNLEYKNVTASYGISAKCPCVNENILKNIICLRPEEKRSYNKNEKNCTSNKGRALICDDKLVGIYHGAMSDAFGDCSFVNDVCLSTKGYNIYLYTCLQIPWIAEYIPGYKNKEIKCSAPLLAKSNRFERNGSNKIKISLITGIITLTKIISM